MAKTLEKLITDQGECSTYDAASQCSRCGYCEQACPTYVVSGKESFSPRGRNQIVRMMMEGKFSDPKSAEEALSTCLLCGACMTACYAHVRTPDLVLEGRRKIRGQEHWLVRLLTRLLEEKPELLARLLKLGGALKKLGLSRLAASSGILKLVGLQGLAEADSHVEEVPEKFLYEYLREDSSLQNARPSDDATATTSPLTLPLSPERRENTGKLSTRWVYFAACGTNYLFPNVGIATIKVLKKHFGPGTFLDNPCCGLLCYNYGDLDAARRLARRNIERFESVLHENAAGSPPRGSAADIPLVADCSSCVAHLKSYPQLFLEEPDWKTRAENFATCVRDMIEMPVPVATGDSISVGTKTEAPAASGQANVVAFHDSCRARHGQGLIDQGRNWARWAAGGSVVELPEVGWCCGGAGAFAFTEPALSEEILKRKISNLASVHASRVVTSSTSCLLQLAHGLKKYYPECQVLHVSELVAEASRESS